MRPFAIVFSVVAISGCGEGGSGQASDTDSATDTSVGSDTTIDSTGSSPTSSTSIGVDGSDSAVTTRGEDPSAGSETMPEEETSQGGDSETGISEDCDPLARGEARFLEWQRIGQLAWITPTADDTHMIFADITNDGLWRGDICGGDREPIIEADDRFQVHVVEGGAALIFERSLAEDAADNGLWRVPIAPDGAPTAEPVKILDATGSNGNPGSVRSDGAAALGYYLIPQVGASWRLVELATPDAFVTLPNASFPIFRAGTPQISWEADGAMVAYDVPTGATEPLGDLVAATVHAWSPDGTILYAAPEISFGRLGAVYAYDIEAQVVEELLEIDDIVRPDHLAVSPSGDVLAVTMANAQDAYLVRL